MTKIEAVVFDIGNVLIGWQPEKFYDRHIGPERRKAMFDTVDLHGANDRLDRGEGFKDIFYPLAEEYPEFREEIRLWHDRWIDLTGPVIDHSVTLLRALRAKGIPVFALTNFGVETFAMSETVYPFLTEFDRRYISGADSTRQCNLIDDIWCEAVLPARHPPSKVKEHPCHHITASLGISV